MGLACFDDPEANEEYFDCEEDEEMQGFAGMLPPDDPAPDPGPCLLSLYIQVALSRLRMQPLGCDGIWLVMGNICVRQRLRINP